MDNDVTVADFELGSSNGFAKAVSITEDQFNWGAANKSFTYNELLLMFKVPPGFTSTTFSSRN